MISVILFWQIFTILQKIFLKMNILSQVLYSIEDNSPKNFTITYNMKGCLRFYTFIFLILLNLAKLTYGLSLIEQHHKVEKKNNGIFVMFRNNLSRFWAFLFTMVPRGSWFSQDWGRGFWLSYWLFTNNLLFNKQAWGQSYHELSAPILWGVRGFLHLLFKRGRDFSPIGRFGSRNSNPMTTPAEIPYFGVTQVWQALGWLSLFLVQKYQIKQ
jgi:hypothetical protein